MLTKLAAINEILVSVGETPALTLVSGAADTTAAETVLDAETRKVLARGWSFNTEEDVEFTPDVSGFLAYPADAIQVDEMPSERRDVQLVKRGTRLMNKTGNTFVFTGPVQCKVIRLLPFDDIPYHVQRVITAQAAKYYNRAYVGSGALDSAAGDELIMAVGAHEDAESETDDLNMLENYDVFGRLARRRYYGVV
jgi:hypothetical protein